MSILSAQESNSDKDLPKSSSFWVRLLKQTLLAMGVSAAILAIYLMAVNERKEDNITGKFAYGSKDGAYIGVIEGRGRKNGVRVFYIKQASSIISIDERYVVVKDTAPKYY
ncbi:MAG: hypothetical protein HY819_07955 [Acidobacteria bacterium]|nr:hypothetical protein [Acidobacteriota bacterium]